MLVAEIAALRPPTTLAHGTFETFDYSIAWSDRWHPTEQTETNLVLTDGITYIHSVGIFDSTPPQDAVPQLVSDWFTNVIVAEDVLQIVAPTSIDSERAFSIYTYGYRAFEDRLDPYAVYFEVRRLRPDLALWMVIDTHLGLYQVNPQTFEDSLSTLQVNGVAASSPVAPSFVSSSWRISVAGALRHESLPTVGLSPAPAMEWLLVVMDVINISRTPAVFDSSLVTIEGNGGENFAPSSLDSRVANGALALDNLTGPVAAGGQARLAFAFQLPESALQERLQVGAVSFPIDTLVQPIAAFDSMPPRSSPPRLEPGIIERLTDRGEVEIRIHDGTLRTIVLVGASIPVAGECHASEVASYFQTLVGRPAEFEHDPAAMSVSSGYLWVEDTTSGPMLLNAQLLAQGFATVFSLPEHTVFAKWLSDVQSVARDTEQGRWSSCPHD